MGISTGTVFLEFVVALPPTSTPDELCDLEFGPNDSWGGSGGTKVDVWLQLAEGSPPVVPPSARSVPVAEEAVRFSIFESFVLPSLLDISRSSQSSLKQFPQGWSPSQSWQT